MKEKVGQVFSIAKDNQPIKNLTISKLVSEGQTRLSYFSLAEDTGISPEIHPYYKLILLAWGKIKIYGEGFEEVSLEAGDCLLTPIDQSVGIRTSKGGVYIEVEIGRKDKMNEQVKPGEVFKLKDLIPYQEDKVVNLDFVHNDHMKFVLMAFDQGTSLSDHAAPAEALVFALDGEATIGYEGEDHKIKAGESFHFAKGGTHSIKADQQFKMGLLLIKE